MAELKIKIPDELKSRIERFEIDVSPAVVKTIESELLRFVALKVLASKSKLTKRGALELGKLLKHSRAKELELA